MPLCAKLALVVFPIVAITIATVWMSLSLPLRQLDAITSPSATDATHTRTPTMLPVAPSTSIQMIALEVPSVTTAPSKQRNRLHARKASFICQEYRARIGWRSSSCPGDEKWLRRMMGADPYLVHKAFMVVGCNTGVDAVRFLKIWGNQSGIMAKWKSELAQIDARPGECKQNLIEPFDDLMPMQARPSRNRKRRKRSSPRVFCIEPGPSNFQILQKVRQAVFGDWGPLTVVQAAGSDHEGTGFFPDGPAGSESGVLKQHGTGGDVPVRTTTVDQLISDHHLTGLDGLVIDAECHDPSVLAGATNALLKVRYLLFEVTQSNPKRMSQGCARDTPSGRTTLRSLVHMLDERGFDCYWAGNTGRLHRLTGCWKNSDAAFHGPLIWTNVACVKRGDVWHRIFENLDKGLP